jgi:hypothetical protein
MTEDSSKGSDDIKSREDLQQWLIDEVRDSTKALDLRLREPITAPERSLPKRQRNDSIALTSAGERRW